MRKASRAGPKQGDRGCHRGKTKPTSEPNPTTPWCPIKVAPGIKPLIQNCTVTMLGPESIIGEIVTEDGQPKTKQFLTMAASVQEVEALAHLHHAAVRTGQEDASSLFSRLVVAREHLFELWDDLKVRGRPCCTHADLTGVEHALRDWDGGLTSGESEVDTLALCRELEELEARIGPSRRKKGRPVTTDPKRDKRWYQAWKSGEHKTYADCARALDVPEQELRRAIDRHEKRMFK